MKLKIFGKDCKVKLVKGMKEQGYLGLFYPDKFEIHIDATLKGEEYYSVLVHECFHGLFHRVGFNQTRIPIDVQELLAESVATMFTENFKITKK